MRRALRPVTLVALVASATMHCLLPEFSYVVTRADEEKDASAIDATAPIPDQYVPPQKDVIVEDAPFDASAPVGQTGSWELVFDDEFDGTTLDESRWIRCFPWGSAAGCALVPNPDVWYAPENVSVEGGTLRLRAERRTTTVQDKTYHYASGMVSTAGFGGLASYRRRFRYGWFEARMRTPTGPGLMGSAWALAPDRQYPPELDLALVRGDQPTIASLAFVYDDGTGRLVESSMDYGGADFASDFHVVAVSWENDALRWYVDGVEARAAFTDGGFVPNEELYFLANLQVGAPKSGAPTLETPLPATMEIDYVRVWRKAP